MAPDWMPFVIIRYVIKWKFFKWKFIFEKDLDTMIHDIIWAKEFDWVLLCHSFNLFSFDNMLLSANKNLFLRKNFDTWYFLEKILIWILSIKFILPCIHNLIMLKHIIGEKIKFFSKNKFLFKIYLYLKRTLSIKFYCAIDFSDIWFKFEWRFYEIWE